MRRMNPVMTPVPDDEILPINTIPADCTINFTNNLLTAYCGKNLNFHKDIYYVPPLKPTIQVLDVSPDDWEGETGIYLTPSQLNSYPELESIIIRRNYILHWSYKGKRREYRPHAFENLFKNILSLKHLEFSNSSLSELWPMPLPIKLKILVVNLNQYSVLDVHWSPQLVEVNANDNILVKLPIFHDQFPKIKILRLKNNTLSNMTMADLASLCHLEVLELQFPNFTRYSKLTEQSYCECDALTLWIKNVKISGSEHLSCFKPTTEENIDCSKYTKEDLEEAKKVRRKCLEEKELAERKSSILLYVIYGVALLLLMAALIAFLFWQKNFFDETSEKLPPVEEIEEEEDLFSDSGYVIQRKDSMYAG